MSALTFACPLTSRAIDSGIDTDENTLRRVRAVAFRLRCPHCANNHDLQVAEGTLARAA